MNRARLTSTNSMSPISPSISSCDACSPRLGEFVQFLFELLEHLLGVLPVEAGTGGARADLRRFHQRGQRTRNAFQQQLRRSPFAFFSSALISSQRFLHVVGGVRLRVAEDVRMPPDQLLVDGVEAVFDAEVPGLRCHLRVEDGLQHEVAEFVGQPRPVARVDRVQHLVGLFERVGLIVSKSARDPRDSRRRAQTGHDRNQLFELFACRGIQCVRLACGAHLRVTRAVSKARTTIPGLLEPREPNPSATSRRNPTARSDRASAR